MYQKVCVECSVKHIVPTYGIVSTGSMRCDWCKKVIPTGKLHMATDEITVELTYFKPNGKYYSQDELKISGLGKPLHEIWSMLEGKVLARELPGLKKGHSDYLVLVDVPRHPHNCPHLLNTEAILMQEKTPSFLSQALNEGDGVYRP